VGNSWCLKASEYPAHSDLSMNEKIVLNLNVNGDEISPALLNKKIIKIEFDNRKKARLTEWFVINPKSPYRREVIPFSLALDEGYLKHIYTKTKSRLRFYAYYLILKPNIYFMKLEHLGLRTPIRESYYQIEDLEIKPNELDEIDV